MAGWIVKEYVVIKRISNQTSEANITIIAIFQNTKFSSKEDRVNYQLWPPLWKIIAGEEGSD